MTVQELTGDQAIAILKTLTSNTQPLQFQLQEQYYILLDRHAIPATAGCFCDVIELLLKVFYVFDLAYSYELKPVHGLLEHVMSCCCVVRLCPTLWHDSSN